MIDTFYQSKLIYGLEDSIRRRTTLTLKRALRSNTLSCVVYVIFCVINFQSEEIKACNLIGALTIMLNMVLQFFLIPPLLIMLEINDTAKIIFFSTYKKVPLKTFITRVGRGYSYIESCFGFYWNITVYSLRMFSIVLFLFLAITLGY